MTLRETRSTCPYCGVGCGVIIESQGDQITGVRGDPNHPANFGRLCTKGQALHLTATASITLHARLREPRLRQLAASWQAGADTRTLGSDVIGLPALEVLLFPAQPAALPLALDLARDGLAHHAGADDPHPHRPALRGAR